MRDIRVERKANTKEKGERENRRMGREKCG